MENKHILGIRIQLEKLITQREGMIVLNKYREMRNETIAYDEKAFIDLSSELDSLYYQLYQV